MSHKNDLPEEDVRSLKEDVIINKRDLPGQWEHHPQLYRYWAEEYAIACFERDQAKEVLDLTVADLDIDIRNDPEAYGLKKVTESSIQSLIKQQESYDTAVTTLNAAKYAVSRMLAAKEAMEHKRDALKNLTALALGDFYSANTAPPDASVKKAKLSHKKFAEKKRKLIV